MKRILPFLIVVAVLAVGCSKVTPTPEIVIKNTNPPGGIVGTLSVTFVNMNKVDAILTRRVVTYIDTMNTAPVSQSYNISCYVSAEYDSTIYTFSPDLLPMAGVTSGRSLSVTFYGTDAYGYDKEFSVATENIWY